MRGLSEPRRPTPGLSPFASAVRLCSAGVTIPQGQANGYPLYRLEWQDLGSLPRRIRNCRTGVRAQPLPAHSVEMVELELHLARRALGMAVETPAVRP